MVTRTYSCLNRNCRAEFNADGDHPPCPRCRGLRVQWVPKPVAIGSGLAASVDKIARELTADFGLSDYRSPQRGRAAMRPPAIPHAGPIKTPETGAPMTFEPARGWRITLPDAALAGGGHAVCIPAGVTAKVKVDPNAGGLPETNWGSERIRAHTRIEGSHRGKVAK